MTSDNEAANPPATPRQEAQRSYGGFDGTVTRTFGGSEPHWPRQPPQAPPGSPNVVVILADDLGYADLGCYGSEIATPNLDRLADEGVRYTDFHVNPMCSPTRASLLTGLNAHRAGLGHVAHSDPGFPGYAMELTDEVPTLPEVLRDHGYATLMVGKWHLCKDSNLTDSGPKHSWPCQKGFDRFYGILDGFTNFHQPHRLYQDNQHVHVDEYPDDYYFTDDLTDRAITMVRDVVANDPTKPFFLYFSHGAVHAPLQAKAADIERQYGRYDQGWDAVRASRFERQRQLGIVAPDTQLAPRNHEENDDVAAWDDLDDAARRQYARYMEIFAAMVETVDDSWARLRIALDQLGVLDSTIVIFTSDNGASREGNEQGTAAYFRSLSAQSQGGADNSLAEDVARFDLLGSARTLAHYPRGWAMAGNTPFRLYKTHTYAGGHQVPFIVRWPEGSVPAGEMRRQYQHITDLMPTVLDACGVDRPPTHRGEPAVPLAGASFRPSLTDPGVPSSHPEQYYELEGRRGLYRDGWEVVTNHQPQTPFGDHEWALYDLANDPTELTDLRDNHPDRLAELAEAWEQAAWANQVFPLDEGMRIKWIQRPPWEAVYEHPVTIVPGTPTLERYRSAKLIWLRDYSLSARLDWRPGDAGVLVAHGDQGGGYVIYIEDDRVHYLHNGGARTWSIDGGSVGDAGPRVVECRAVNGGAGTVAITLAVDGEDRGHLDAVPMLIGMAPFEGIDVGIDRRSPVSWDLWQRHRSFPYSGHLHSVTVTPGELAPTNGLRWIDFLKQQAARFE